MIAGILAPRFHEFVQQIIRLTGLAAHAQQNGAVQRKGRQLPFTALKNGGKVWIGSVGSLEKPAQEMARCLVRCCTFGICIANCQQQFVIDVKRVFKLAG